MGYAIGHFARWITKGAIRLEAVSPDSLVQVSAFRDNTKQRLITVIINNASVQKSIALKLTGLSISGNSSGEQSTAAVFWNPLSAISSTSLTTNYLIPALSVTTISSPFENSTTPTPPATLTTTPSPTPTSQPLTPGDTNGDRAINLTDLTIVLTNFGKSGVSIGRAQGDLDGSHSVTLSDLTIILANFGKTS